jgi:hypothetical protein
MSDGTFMLYIGSTLFVSYLIARLSILSDLVLILKLSCSCLAVVVSCRLAIVLSCVRVLYCDCLVLSGLHLVVNCLRLIGLVIVFAFVVVFLSCFMISDPPVLV